MRIFGYGIARTRLDRAIRERKVPAVVADDMSVADAIIAIRSSMQRRPEKLKERLGRTVPTVIIKSNTLSQIAGALDDIFSSREVNTAAEQDARAEALEAVKFVRQKGKPFELSPREFGLRVIQHEVAEAHRLRSESVGKNDQRRVRVLPEAI